MLKNKCIRQYYLIQNLIIKYKLFDLFLGTIDFRILLYFML